MKKEWQNFINVLLLIISAFLLCRAILLANLIFNYSYLLIFSIILISSIYIPFTYKSFNFIDKPLKKIVFKYVLINLIPLPFFSPFLNVFGGIVIPLSFLICEILFLILIIFVYYTNKFVKKPSTIVFMSILIIIILLILNAIAVKIPAIHGFKSEFKYYNGYAKFTNNPEVCERIDIDSLINDGTRYDLMSCDKFNEFGEDGKPLPLYKNVAPTYAFYVPKNLPKGLILKLIENKEEIQRKYGFDDNASYYDVCKQILSDLAKTAVGDCKKAIAVRREYLYRIDIFD